MTAESEQRYRVLSLQSAVLSVAEVQRISTELRALPGVQAIAIDCQQLQRVNVDGLAALHDLGASVQGRLALTGLSRALVRTAVQARLSRRFAI